MSAASPENDIPRRHALIILLLLCAGALGLRLIGITQESAWWDEYSSLVHLKSPTLWEFLVNNRTYDPATLPLYYTIEYLWSRVAGTATVVMRVPSLALGIAIVPAAYALGARLFSRRAGLIAAACLAASPIHAFHAQGIRMYVLFTLLAVLSVHTFVLVWRDNRGLWRHALVQLLLSWTHPFALLVPAVQDLAWLLSGGPRNKALWRWVGVTGVAWLPAIIYLSTVRYYSEDVVTWLQLPTLQLLLTDIFTDDVIAWDYSVYMTEGAWRWLPWGLGEYVRAARPIMDWALALILVGGALWAVAQLARDKEARGKAALLVLWVVLPVMALYLASLLIRPMYAARYTVHSSVAMYLLASAAIVNLPAWPRRVGTVLLIGLMLYQTSLLHPGPQRTNYLGAAQIVREKADPNNDVLIVSSSFEFNTLRYNFLDAPLPMMHLEGTPLTYLAAFRMLSNAEALGRPMNVWIFHVFPYFEKYPERVPQEVLPKLGLDFEHYGLPGIQGIFLVRVSLGKETADRAQMLAELEQTAKGYAPDWWAYNFLEQSIKLNLERPEPFIMAACECFYEGNPLRTLMCNDGKGISPARARAIPRVLTALGDNEFLEGEEALRAAAQEDPTMGFPHLYLGGIATAKGDADAAMASFRQAVADPDMEWGIGEWYRALERRDTAAAMGIADGLHEKLGPDTPGLLKKIAEELGKLWAQGGDAANAGGA